MTASVSRQGEANPEFWLANWASEMGFILPARDFPRKKKKKIFLAIN